MYDLNIPSGCINLVRNVQQTVIRCLLWENRENGMGIYVSLNLPGPPVRVWPERFLQSGCMYQLVRTRSANSQSL